MVELLVLKPGKEFIILRKARKHHDCGECPRLIWKGEYYVEDHINYARRGRGGEAFKWYVTHKVCLSCWRGPLPSLPFLQPSRETSELEDDIERKWSLADEALRRKPEWRFRSGLYGGRTEEA